MTSVMTVMMMTMVLVDVDGPGARCVVCAVVTEQVFADLQDDSTSVIARVATPL